MTLIPDRSVDDCLLRGGAIAQDVLDGARTILDDVERRGAAAVRACAERYGDLEPGAAMVHHPDDLDRALAQVTPDDRGVLERTAARIARFASAQLESCGRSLESEPAPGVRAGHRAQPVEAAGCYAPGGRFPLPSSVLMTAVTARVAGVPNIWVASPKPTTITLAAAAIAGADGLLAVGGAQAIGAFAYGCAAVPACDVIVGPGNAWVTAAKQHVAGRVRIDMLAGPSELVVIADETADPALIAADLIAQAEHDPDARPILISVGADANAVRRELEAQLRDLPTADIARQSLTANGAVLTAGDRAEAARWSDAIAPEHLQLALDDAPAFAGGLRNYGAVFVGERSAEVLGDYGAGPNHVLPTGGTARSTAGLSVMTFLRFPTWLEITETDDELVADAVALARLEGLEGHARAAERRSGCRTLPV